MCPYFWNILWTAQTNPVHVWVGSHRGVNTRRWGPLEVVVETAYHTTIHLFSFYLIWCETWKVIQMIFCYLCSQEFADQASYLTSQPCFGIFGYTALTTWHLHSVASSVKDSLRTTGYKCPLDGFSLRTVGYTYLLCLSVEHTINSVRRKVEAPWPPKELKSPYWRAYSLGSLGLYGALRMWRYSYIWDTLASAWDTEQRRRRAY